MIFQIRSNKAYMCDSCRAIIEHPYSVGMKEFGMGLEIDYCGVFPMPAVRRVRVHLCDDCYKSLKSLVKEKT